ncbi:DUF5916 domain-containing protein [Deltaproteobacteria bacterium]|nr:DUF5916 domain-containing protein [Deltaproteobacteria bacterium]
MRSLFTGKSFLIGSTSIINSLLLAALLLVPGTALAELNIDGRLDDPDWAEAQVFRDFVVVEPLTFETPHLQTEALLLAIPEGLAVAFICEQPEENRTHTITQRDSEFDSDSVSLLIDFDGRGEIVYQFDVSITGSYRDGTVDDRHAFNRDWDGLWQHAVNEEPQSWTVEILLPWSIVAMRAGIGDTRQLAMFFQRDIYMSSESFAFPATSSSLTSRFLSDFAKIEVRSYSSQEFDVWPYVTAFSDLMNDSITGKAGLDLFWKPSGRFQVAATFNPDFGQVESDDLVIDFSAIEVQFSDKRPFFTENQSIFDDFLIKNEKIFYTRRIGGPRDDNGEPSDIDGALKVIGSAGSLKYGFFTAHEADEAGRSYYAGRVVFPGENWMLGVETTYTDRPFLERTALVNTLNYDIRVGDSLRFLGQFISSVIDSNAGDSDGLGAINFIQYTPNDRWYYETSLIQYEDSLDINDMGYLRRNAIVEPYFRIQYNQTDFPEDSRTASVSWMIYGMWPRNTGGVELTDSVNFRVTQRMRSGSNVTFNTSFSATGYDDLISRGNGFVRLNKRWRGGLSYRTPRRGAWSKSVGLSAFQEGYEGWGAGIETSISWYPHEKLSMDFSLNPRWSRDWLIWLHNDLLASFSRRNVTGEITANLFPAEGHEVRLRSQWLTINADAKQGYRIGTGGRLVPSNDLVNDFAMINFGLQLRYRYEIAPLSDFYIVYSRGGLDRIDDPTQSTMDLLSSSTSLRNSDQFLVKLRYRF